MAIALSIVAGALHAQKGIHYKKFTTDNGMPYDIGYKMHQDKKGYLWVGTDDGLGRFDGTEWKVYNTEDGLPSPFPIAIDEDEQGALWIASWNGGISIMQGDSIQHLNLEGNNRAKLNGLAIISQDELLTWSYGNLYRCRKKPSSDVWKVTRVVMPYERADGTFEMIMIEDAVGMRKFSHGSLDPEYYYTSTNNLLLFGMGHTVFEYQADSLYTTYYQTPAKKDSIYSVFEDETGGMWYGGRGKLYYRNSRAEEMMFNVGLPNKRIYSINVVAGQYAYLITGEERYKNREIYRYDIKRKTCIYLNEVLGIEVNPAHMLQDREYNLWLTTDGDGLFCLYPSFFNYYSAEEGLSSEFVSTITEDLNGDIWVGTKHGIFILQSGRFQSLPINAGTVSSPLAGYHKVKDILFVNDGSGRFWGASGGLGIGGKNYRAIKNDSIAGEKLMLDAQGRLLMLYAPGNVIHTLTPIKELAQYDITDPKYPEYYYYQLKNSIQFSSSYNNRERKVFMLDKQGMLYRLDDESYEIQLIADKLPIKALNVVFEDGNRNLWIGTNEGLCFVQFKNGQYEFIQKYTKKDGLISNRCEAILTDHNGLLWVGTPYGLMYFNGKKFVTYTYKSGLLSDGVNALHLDRASNLWVGGSKGVSVINIADTAAQPKTHEQIPAPIFEGIAVNGGQVLIDSLNASFSYNSNLQVFFKGITYTYPETLKYQYQLNGGEWIPISNAALTLSSLRPSKYDLKVRVKRLNSEWSESLQVYFVVLPPWWMTWWAIACYVMMLIGGLVTIMNVQRKRVRRKEEERLRINKVFTELELKALQAQMNPHFIFNALNSIQGFILDSDELKANDYLSSFSHLMRMFLESSKSKYISVAQEVKLLELYIDLEGLRFGERFEFSIVADPNIASNDYKIPCMLIQPYIENAINHGLAYKQGKGTLLIEFKKREEGILCVIDDNGVGREKALEIKSKMKKKHRSRAMQIVDERLTALNSIDGIDVSIDVIDKQDEQGEAAGTQVNILFPLLLNS